MNKATNWALALTATAALTACGGGGSGASDAPASGSITIAGTAAKGAALAGATVSATCATGTGTATTAIDGAYTLTIANAALPCVLRATGTEGSVFHTLVPGSGISGTFRANLTPLSEMVVARVGGATPAAYFASFGGGTTVTAASVAQAVDYVKAALAGTADLGTANPLSDTLVVGNALDQKIDVLMAALASNNLTLAQVSAAIVANPSAPAVIAAPLAPVAAACAWLKNGRYRIINPFETVPRWRAHVLAINAEAATALDQDNATITFTSEGACQYSVSSTDFTTKVMVSSSGVLVMYSQSNTNSALRRTAIGLPEQSLPLSEFAGTWNLAGWDPASGIPAAGYIAQTDEVTIDANGAITAHSECVGTAACTSASGPFSSFAANTASGGFDLVASGVAAGRVFMFKTLAGKAAWVLIADDGHFIVATRKETLGALPAVGTATYFREFALNGNGTVSDLTENTVTVTATDAAAQTITRLRASDNRVDTLGVDYPRTGVRHRALNACTINGVASNCSQLVQLPLQGMGITLSLSVGLTNPSAAFYNISVGRPVVLN